MNKTEMWGCIRKYYHLEKNKDLATFFGVSEQLAFMRVKKGFLVYEDIWRLCPEISPDWLLSGGQGPMLRADRGEQVPINYFRQEVPPEKNNSKEMEMALEALAKEQEATKVLHDSLVKAQEQISALIELGAKR